MVFRLSPCPKFQRQEGRSYPGGGGGVVVGGLPYKSDRGCWSENCKIKNPKGDQFGCGSSLKGDF